jgi:hypothetical protein
MPHSPKLDELVAALDALSPAEHDTVLRRLRSKPLAALSAAVVVVVNQGKAEALLDDGGAAAQRLARGATLQLAIPPLPLARGPKTPSVPDVAGLPTAPKSLVSLRASTGDKTSTELRVDLTGWIANAARCGWPFAFHRHADEKAGASWDYEARPVFELAAGKAAPVHLIVMGLGVDLSEFAERFAMVFETRPADGEAKESAK